MRTASVDDPRTGPTLFYLAIGVILFAVAVFALQGYYGRALAREVEGKESTPSSGQFDRLRTGQLEQMAMYRWIDADAGVVAIPIDRAVDLVIEELARQPESGL